MVTSLYTVHDAKITLATSSLREVAFDPGSTDSDHGRMAMRCRIRRVTPEEFFMIDALAPGAL